MNDVVFKASVLDSIASELREQEIFANWPRPEPIAGPEVRPNPFPVHALGEILGGAAQAIAGLVKAPEGIAAQCVLGVAAMQAQRLVNAPSPTNSSGQPASLLLLTIAGSGEGKDSCESIACRPIYELEREALTNYSKAMKDYRRSKDESVEPPPNPRRIFREATWPKVTSHIMQGGYPSIVWFTTEAGAFMGGHSMQAENRMVCVGGLIQGYDDGRFERLRVGDQEGSGSVWDRRLSLHLLGQPAVMHSAVHDGMLHSQGLWPRFMLCYPKSLAGTRILTLEDLELKAEENPAVLKLWRRVRTMHSTPANLSDDGGLNLIQISQSNHAKSLWLHVYNEVEKAQGPDGDYSGIMQPFARRTPQHILRVASTLAVFDEEDEITEEKMRNASELALYSLNTWTTLLTTSAVDKEIAASVKLLQWLLQHPAHRSARILQTNGPKPRSDIKAIRDLLKLLEAAGWVRTYDAAFEKFVVYGDRHA